MDRPRLLLVTQITELEWRIKPLLEEWADVATYDSPGVGDEPRVDQLDYDGLVAHGVAQLDRRGWDRCVIAGDEFASGLALRIAAERPDRVAGLALGHAALSYRDNETGPIDSSVMAGFRQLLATDFRSWARAYTQITQGAYDDATMERFIERVPPDVAQQLAQIAFRQMRDEDDSYEPLLRGLGVPLLFAEHRDCIVFRREGFEEAAAAFPDAARLCTPEKPNCSPAFAEALREFCEPLFSADP